ncbi:type II toxin-antitoxin system VapC family toxin [Allorhizobium taibaishanense]|uniref:Ribonuclease VapC n=1 Tax=Allorhizobium taibaishanense TaxID=887144 RepID=A0A1Q9A2X3_9HYPH|nr:type II toxin-antitoxin system VapC family toxin [Allorhizobium taibaishanense]MBB4005780.1 hypothetical protein [Allorhizobium taibaishanense]OLP48828.1 hypothetical protein BJF91_16980 [Allorhizobium taibaishanense]
MFNGDQSPLDRARPLLLLDTNILSARARVRPPVGLTEWLKEASDTVDFCVCFPVLVEIKRGALLALDPSQAKRIRDAIDAIIRTDFIFLGAGEETAEIYARMLSTKALKNIWYVKPYSKHNRISQDLLIAAIAISHGIPIVTCDCDYQLIDSFFKLPGVYDPITSKWTIEPAVPIDLPTLPQARGALGAS